jgi:hypothetical protein
MQFNNPTSTKMKTKNMTTPHSKKTMGRSPSRLALVLIPLAIACFALSPQARADCQEGCDLSNFSTFLGDSALVNNTGASNTAVGSGALTSNTVGSQNTAIGVDVLSTNTTGLLNTASGFFALRSNTEGYLNTANGSSALSANTTGNRNTATGSDTLTANTSGNGNTASGDSALAHTTGDGNTAVGFAALTGSTTGSNNIAVGASAGLRITTGSNNIEIGNQGFAGDSGNIRIGTTGTNTKTFIAGISGVTVSDGVGVIVGANGKLGTVVSSARFKEAIQPMDKTSEAILALKPVTFRYKHELDPAGIPQFGLVAEDVEKVNPDLVARDDHGKPYSVRYEAVNAMLLNEFLKEHRKVEQLTSAMAKQEATISQLESTVAQQQKDLGATAAHQQEQIEALSAAIQKVSAQVEMSRPAPQTVVDNH